MAMKSAGQVPWVLVLVALAAVAASGRGCAWAQAARTQTKPTPSLAPEPTPSLAPEPTPSLAPEPTPSLAPEPTPSLAPEPTPSMAPEPTPSLAPEPTQSCDACSYVDETGNCNSLCFWDDQCTVRNGKAFCVRCNFFRQEFPDGTHRLCCQQRGGDSGPLCRPKVEENGDENQCFTNEGPWTTKRGKPKNPQPYTIDAVQNVCYSRDNFWVNRKLCKIQYKENGEKYCRFIKKKNRDRILAGRWAGHTL